MVRAILAGQKTVTRRVVKDFPVSPSGRAVLEVVPSLLPHRGDRFDVRFDLDNPRMIRCPYGAPGDRLWLRESWASADTMYQNHENDVPSVVAYRADRAGIQWSADPPRLIPDYDRNQWNWDVLSWKPSIHMPRWASRITLAVTDVRVERLHAIDDEDAVREGVGAVTLKHSGVYREQFRVLWDAINGKRAPWSSNPWVWRVAFERVTP